MHAFSVLAFTYLEVLKMVLQFQLLELFASNKSEFD